MTTRANPADAVTQWAIDKIKPYDRNARTHSPAQVAQIVASIQEWGWTNPVLVTPEGRLIAGHGRLLAARELKLARVPVIVAKDWTDAQVQAYTLADNRLALESGWDETILAVELAELRDADFDLPALGFSPAELQHLIGLEEFAPGTIDDQGLLDQKTPVTCPKCGHEFTT